MKFLFGYDPINVNIIAFLSHLLTFPFFCQTIAKISHQESNQFSYLNLVFQLQSDDTLETSLLLSR